VVLVCFVVLVGSRQAAALDPSIRLTQYAHRTWTVRDGYFSGAVQAIAQTADGYLWIGSFAGLSRFDGVRFVSFEQATGKRLPNQQVSALFVSRDGSLWIGTASGLFRWSHDELRQNLKVEGSITSITEASGGVLWIAQVNPRGAEPLCSIKDEVTTCFKRPDGVVGDSGCCTGVVEARDGVVWATGRNLLMRRQKNGFETFPIDAILAKSQTDGPYALAVGAGSDLWVGIDIGGKGLGLRRLVNGVLEDANLPGIDASQLAILTLFVDHAGTLWIGTRDQGVYRWTGERVDHFDTHDGLSDNSVSSFFEDREGTIWIGNDKGLDNLHATELTSFGSREGITKQVSSVLAARDGGVWVGTDGALYRLRGNALSSIRAGNGLPGTQVTALLEDRDGRLVLGIDQTVWTYWQGKFSKIVRPDGTNLGIVNDLALDADGSVWATSLGPPRTLFRIRDQRVVESYPAPQGPAVRRVAADPKAGIWLGLLNGELANFHNGSLTMMHSSLHPKQIVDVAVGNDGAVLVATADGLIRWQNGVAHVLNSKVGLPCDAVYSVITDDEHSLWIDSGCALIEISAAELARWWKSPESTIKISRQLDALDGFTGPIFSFTPTAKTADGRLWFANGSDLQMFDPRKLNANSAPPPVLIESVVADHHEYRVQRPLRIPPLTRGLEIDYTALSMAVPQRVRFRYRLEGHDADWQDVGTRRQAYYNDIPPGRYRFRVIACNSSGVWNEVGDVIELDLAPAWFQTTQFRAAVILAALMIAWAVYRLRLRQISTALRLRFNERLDERTRLARDLHDTLLQTIQGSKLAADEALNAADVQIKHRQSLEKLAHWLGRAVEEGRAALNALRYSRADTQDFIGALRIAVDDSMVDSRMQSTFDVSGTPKDMQPIVRDEVYRIAFEAIRNACAHSEGTLLTVELDYGRDLVIRIRDNGKGIDAAILEHGKADHYGMPGMRERAIRIGAALQITSSGQTGTEVVLTVRGGVIF
jgi:ligand-binding sensor domain-containing protein/signal transduction histidine kinase